MELNNQTELERIFSKAIKDRKSLSLFIEMPGFARPEMITNPPENLEKKLDYYRKTYDENLEHKHAGGIKIVGYTF